jgi:hypothetical protein
MSSASIDDTRRKRIQRARKRGLTVDEIAAREAVSTRTVERILSGRRFQQTLSQLCPRIAVQRLLHSDRLDQIIERELRVLETAQSNADPAKGIGLSVQDLIDLAHLVNLLEDRAWAILTP